MPIFRESGTSSPIELDPQSIAVIGLSCRFPAEASSVEKFWEFIRTGKSAYSEASKRWKVDSFHHAARGRVNTSVAKGAHFLDQDIAAFDAGFFNITHNEALAMDPQQRFMLEVAYEAFENAGIPLDKLTGSRTACYVGAYTSDWRETQFRDSESAPLYSINGTGFEFLSNRVSWFYDLKGPSMTIDTACSSSLVAIHQACQNLQSGDSNMAVVGGTSLLLNPDVFLYLSNQGFLAQDGRSKSFDAKGDGYGRGEGCAAVVLKRVDDALRDGDPIRAVIRGSGVNSDGKTKGITLPSADAQADLIRSVYKSAGVDMNATSYVEAHGTGTSAGDPIELRAIAETIGRAHNTSQRVFIGSVKPNIGHLEAAAGLAGLIKSVLSLEKAIIPPNILFETPNPNIPFEKWNLQVPVVSTPWPAKGVRRISVNSFGVGGTNAHVVLDDAENYLTSRGLNPSSSADLFTNQWDVKPMKSIQKSRLFVISAQDQDGLLRQRQSLAVHLKSIKLELPASTQQNTYLRDLAFTLGERRSRLPWKSYVIASSIDKLIESLENVDPNSLSVRSNQVPRLGFVFTGQGAQWARMGVELCQYKVFRESIEHADRYLQSIGAPWSVIEEINRDERASKISLPEFSQPICTVLQVALVDLLASWKIEPTALTGHSSGEIAAAFALGALSREDAWKVAYWRGVLSSQINIIAPSLEGAMLAVGASEEQTNNWISEVTQGEINVACVNSGSSVTVSGDLSGILELQAILQKEGVFERRLKVETAYHSHHMVTISTPYLEAIRDIQVMIPENERRMYSSVPGGFVEASELGPVHWVRNLVSTVLFSDAMLELLRPTHSTDLSSKNAVDIVVEIGPHPALGGPVKQILKANNITGVDYRSVISRGKNGIDTALAFAGAAFAQGVHVDIASVNGDADDFSNGMRKPLVSLPPYSWNHTRTFWTESRLNKQYRMREYPRQSLLGAPMPHYGESERLWRGYLRTSEEPWIRDHKIQSSILYPAAGFIAMAIEGAFQLADKSRAISKFRLRDIQVSVAAVITEDSDLEAVLQLRPHLTATRENSSSWLEFTVSTAASGQDLRQNCSGLLVIEYDAEDHSGTAFESPLEIQSIIEQYRQAEGFCEKSEATENFYQDLQSLGLEYGPTFRNMMQIHSGKGQSCCIVEISDPGSTVISSRTDRPHTIHPATLDAMFHAAFAATKGKDGHLKAAMVPKFIEEIMISADIAFEPGSRFRGYSIAEKAGFRDINADIHMLDDKLNKPMVVVKGFTCTEVSGSNSVEDNVETGSRNLCSQMVWKPALEFLSASQLQAMIVNSDFEGVSRLSELIDLMVHAQSKTSILEFGEVADPVASSLLSAMADKGVPEVFDYTFSTLMASEVQEAETKLKEFKPQVTFKALDIEHGMGAQGFEAQKFDLIIVSRPTDNIHDLDRALSNMQAMLTPGGYIAFTITADTDIWKVALESKKFVPKVYIQDFQSSLIVVTAPTESSVSPSEQIIILESTNPSEASMILAEQISLQLQQLSITTTRSTWGSHLPIEKGKRYISLLELDNSFLEVIGEANFSLLKDLILQSSSLLWVTSLTGPANALMTGLARVVRSENAGSQFRTLQVTSLTLDAGLVIRASTASTEDAEFREENGLLKVSRAIEDLPISNAVTSLLNREVVQMPLSEASKPQKLTIQNPGMLDTLCFETDDSAALELGDEEVEIEVRATGLNFRDVMIAMGQIADTALGVEASGIVLRTGKNVSNVKVGDRVCTMAHGAHRTHLRVRGLFCQIMPEGMSFEEGASLTLVHATAYHALVNLARVRKGQSILIHAAAGGVGQAALQLAKHFELEIFATVGSADKRALIQDVYSIPDDHIFNSRDLSFAMGIKRMTKGRGVDVVLNSLAGEALRKTWYCLAPFGFFVEIGMKDILVNSRLDMQPFLKNSTFTFFNIQDMIFHHPEMVAEICAGTFDFLRRGITKPVSPLDIHPISELENVFRTMQAGKHRGKIALSFDKESTVPILRNPGDAIQLDSNATYVLVGGLGGLGRSLSQLLVDNGARNLCFISRSGTTSPKAAATVRELEAQGITMRIYNCDVSSSDALQAALKSCAQDLPPIKGCIQGAMVLRDVLFENMTHLQWIESTRPKVQGTWNLHKTLPRNLDFFITLSSFAGVFGNMGQGNYAAAGAYQDALSHFRRSEGLTSVTLDLGIMRDVGVLAEQGATDNLKDWVEPFGIREREFHALIKSAIAGSLNGTMPPQVVTGLATGGTVKSAGIETPFYFEDPRFSTLLRTGVQSTNGNASDAANASLARATQISTASSFPAVVEIVTEAMVEKVAKMMQTSTSEVDITRPLYSYGVDSLVAIEMRNWVIKELKSDVALFDVLSAVPMAALCEGIAQRCKVLPEGIAK